MTKRESSDVDGYIARGPEEAQGGLAKIRAAIRAVAPGATERTDYFHIPGYSYPGFDYDGMFAWFSFKKPYIRLHVRPPVLQQHREEGSAQESDNLPERPAFSERWPLASLRG